MATRYHGPRRRANSFAGCLVILLLLVAAVLPVRSAETLPPQAVWESTPSNRPPPVFFTAACPKDYTERDLSRALRRRLAPEEVSLVVNPLASTPEMNNWARELTAKATNDLQKAQFLYQALVIRVSAQPADFPHPPTAQEVFAAWNKPGAAFGCQDLAFLYVALARGAGLKSYHTFVAQDFRGIRLLHGCAAVFIGGKALLVDPSYSTFGIAHKKFTVLDDLQTAALYLTGLRDLKRWEIAAKLAPDLSIAQAGLVEMLAQDGRWKEAEAATRELARLDPQGPATFCARARMAEHAGRPDEAITLLREAAKLAPETPMVHSSLAMLYQQQSKWAEAREAFENALRYAVFERSAQAARAAIASTYAQECLAKADWDGALTNWDKVVELGSTTASVYELRGFTHYQKGNLTNAISDYSRAVQLDPANVRVRLGRATAYDAFGQFDKAISDLNECLRRNPKDAEALGMRGRCQGENGQFDAAVRDFDQAIRLGTTHAGTFRDFAWVRATCPVAAPRNGKQAVALATKACEMTEWKQPWCLETLAAAYAEAGEFDKAVKSEKQAMTMTGAGEHHLKEMQALLSLYERHQPYHMTRKEQRPSN
jgi:tetratricopeptide (TPR) repeat protein